MGPRSPRRLICGLLYGATAVEAIAQDSRPVSPDAPEGARRNLRDAPEFTVEWRTPVDRGTDAEIEVDSGRYHGCDESEPHLAWYRIRRTGDRFEVLHLETGGGRDPVAARSVRIQRARMTPAESEALRRDLEWIAAARLAEREPSSWSFWGGRDCRRWTYARVGGGSRPPWEDAWAGGPSGSYVGLRQAKPRAFVERVEESVSKVRFEAFEPSAADRKRILEDLSQRTYAGRPREAFGESEGRLSHPYKRLVLALGGDPDTCLPPPREEVDVCFEGEAAPLALNHVTVLRKGGDPVEAFFRYSTDDGQTVWLEPGEYVVVLDAPDYEPRRVPITLRRGGFAAAWFDLVKRGARR